MTHNGERQAGESTTEIEITPEMIDAGMGAYDAHSPYGRSEKEISAAIAAIFKAMLEAHTHEKG